MGEHVEPVAHARRDLPLPRLDAAIPLPADLPVAGGWGYSRDEPCIITDHREPAPDEREARGRDHALFFIPERLLLELNAMEIEEPLVQIRWRVVTQELERDAGGRPVLDHYKVNLSAYPRDDLDALEAQTQETEVDDTKRRMELHTRRARLRFSNDCDFWFDISGVPGIPEDADMYMIVSSGRFGTSYDE